MKIYRHAKRYATMFLNAVDINAAPGAMEELNTAVVLAEASEDFYSLLTSPMFSGEERAAALKAVGERAGFSGHTVKFLDFIAAEGAGWALGQIARKAEAILAEKQGTVTATVVSPAAMGSEYEGRISEALRKVTGRDVKVEYETDPSLLGGMKIMVGSTMFDGSLQGQLRLLKDELIKG